MTIPLRTDPLCATDFHRFRSGGEAEAAVKGAVAAEGSLKLLAWRKLDGIKTPVVYGYARRGGNDLLNQIDIAPIRLTLRQQYGKRGVSGGRSVRVATVGLIAATSRAIIAGSNPAACPD